MDGADDHAEITRVYYDSACGLCHRTVRFAVTRDRRARLRFAPVGGATWDALAAAEREALPDSVVVATPDGRLFARSRAVVQLLWVLGGGWRWLGALLWLVPWPVRDLGYRAVAAVRRRLFRPPEGACPLVPAHLRERFEA